MNLRRTVEKTLCAGAIVALAFAWTLGEAQARQEKPKTTNAAPVKPTPAKSPPAPVTAAHPAPAGPGAAVPAGAGPRGGAGIPAKPETGPIGSYQPRPGEQAKPLRGGGQEFHDPRTNRTVATNAHGEVRRIEAPRGLAGGKLVVNRGPGGGRIVETGRPGARVVSYGVNRGFAERPLRPGYISRTYVVGGRSYARVYREYRYRGIAYYRYVPTVYYGPGFYAWAVTPWGAPVGYAWGSGLTAPWFGFYAGYFTPYPAYTSPDLWLTDYLFAENLRLAYENQQAGNAGQASAPPSNIEPAPVALSPEMKALIADEVRQQLAAERRDAVEPVEPSPQQSAVGSEQLPSALNQRFFVVPSDLDLTTAAGQACTLTPGDIIQRKGQTVTTDGGVAVEVVSSKLADCAAGYGATVQLADLQEMHNQFREQIDSGLQKLAEHQGLPTPPPTGQRPVAEGTADPVPDAESKLMAQETAAGNLEAQVRQGGS